MGGIRIEGTSSNVADVTSNNNLKVQLPTAVSQMGGVRMFSENDDGAITGTANVKSPETSSDYRLRVGVDQVIDSQDWTIYNYTNVRKFKHYATTLALMSPGSQGLSFGGVTSSGNTGIYGLRKFGMLGNSADLFFEQSFRLTTALDANCTLEFGVSGRTSSTSVSGIYFRVTSAGVFGVVGSTVTSVMLEIGRAHV